MSLQIIYYPVGHGSVLYKRIAKVNASERLKNYPTGANLAPNGLLYRL